MTQPLYTHLIALKVIDNAQPVKEEDFISFKFLVENTGVQVVQWEDDLIKIYSNTESSASLLKFLNDSTHGKWGRNIQNVVEKVTFVGPFELREPKIKPGI